MSFADKVKSEASGTGWGYQGIDNIIEANKKQQEEYENRKNNLVPWRYFLNKGEKAEIIVLDRSVNDLVAVLEHNLQGPDGKYGVFELCCSEGAGTECPICKNTDNKPYLVLFVTILDCRPYTSKKTGKTISATRKLLAIKGQEIAVFTDLFKKAEKKHGTLRGTSIFLQRGTDQKSVRTGIPVSDDEGMLFQPTPESVLEKEFGHEAVVDRNGKVLEEANSKLKPYNYRELFPKPDPEDIAKRHGWAAPAGSRRHTQEQLQDTPTVTSRRQRVAAPVEDEIPMDTPRRRIGPPPAEPADTEDESPFDQD